MQHTVYPCPNASPDSRFYIVQSIYGHTVVFQVIHSIHVGIFVYTCLHTVCTQQLLLIGRYSNVRKPKTQQKQQSGTNLTCQQFYTKKSTNNKALLALELAWHSHLHCVAANDVGTTCNHHCSVLMRTHRHKYLTCLKDKYRMASQLLQCGPGGRLVLFYVSIYRNSKSTSLALEAALPLQVL